MSRHSGDTIDMRSGPRATARPESDYLADLREMEFMLFDLFEVEKEFLCHEPYRRGTREMITALIGRAHEFASELGRHYRSADREACSLLEDGAVRLPAAFPRLWERYRSEWAGLLNREGEDRQLTLVGQIVMELFMGANPAFMTYGGFTVPAIRLIERAGTDHQRGLFLPRLKRFEWDACFCATEAQAGSDITAIRTLGLPGGEGIYSIAGEKLYISAGMHSLTENTVYFVLARSSATAGDSYSMSCFLVPKLWPEADGTLSPNNIECVKIEEKMGLKACANAHLVFGRRGVTRGYALGDRINVGLLQLAPLMREARMSTGLFAVGMASSAYLHALRYARTRVQGRRFEHAVNLAAPRVPIIEHADVQRMLLEMKSKVEGCRALIGGLSYHAAKAHVLRLRPSPQAEELKRHQAMVEFYTPLVTAYASDQAWRVCELAIQVHGGVGYLADRPVEQYARDVKILSIWEGTNYIQARDLVREKLHFGRDSEIVDQVSADIRAFVDQHRARHGALAPEFDALEVALDAVLGATRALAELSRQRKYAHIEQLCTRYLEMFAETVVAWHLLRAACVSAAAMGALPAAHPDREFHEGHIRSARFFSRNILPQVSVKAALLRDADAACVGWFAPAGEDPREEGAVGHPGPRKADAAVPMRQP